LLGQAPHVVVALDGHGFLALGATAFDHIGVDGALGEEGRAFVALPACFEFGGLGLENIHKEATDDLALLLGLAHAGQAGEEEVARVHANDARVQFALEHLHDMIALVQAQEAVVHEHAGELVANGAVNQGGGNRGVHAAGEAQDDLFVAHLLADGVHGFLNVVAHDPIGLGRADLQHKALEQGPPLHGVGDFGVELHGVEMAIDVGHAGNGTARGAGHELEAGRHFGDFVPVAHPDLEHAVALGGVEIGNVFEQWGVAMGADFGVAKLARVAALDLATELLGHGLHAVANAQHGHTQGEDGCGGAVGALLVHAGVAAR